MHCLNLLFISSALHLVSRFIHLHTNFPRTLTVGTSGKLHREARGLAGVARRCNMEKWGAAERDPSREGEWRKKRLQLPRIVEEKWKIRIVQRQQNKDPHTQYSYQTSLWFPRDKETVSRGKQAEGRDLKVLVNFDMHIITQQRPTHAS